MTEVELGDLKKVGKEIAQSLGQKLKAEVAVKGRILVVPDTLNGKRVGVKDLKLLLKHALHQLGFSKEYRVLAEHGKVRIVRIEEKPKPAEREGRVPAPSQSLPYLFP